MGETDAMTRDAAVKLAVIAYGPDLPPEKSKHEWLADKLQQITNAARAVERERCAKVAENGYFLHDDAPTARFGREVAAAIRRGN